jgi:hypothetical protein
MKAESWSQNVGNGLARIGFSTSNTTQRILQDADGQLVAHVEGDHWLHDTIRLLDPKTGSEIARMSRKRLLVVYPEWNFQIAKPGHPAANTAFLALVAGQESFTQRSNAGCINSKGNRVECKDGCNGIWQAFMLIFFILVVMVAQSARSLSKCQICKCNNQREYAKVGDWLV